MSEEDKASSNIFRNRKLILISVCVVVILGIAALLAVHFGFMAKSPRQFYLESESKNVKRYSDQIKQVYNDFYTYQKPYMDSRYKDRLELTADLQSGEEKPFGLSNAKDIFDIIRKCKLVVDSNNDPNAKKSLTKLSLLLESAPMLDAEVYTNNRQMGVTIPVFLPDKYFMVNLDKLDEVYDRLESRYNLLPLKPKRVLKKVDIAKAISFSNEEFDGVIKDYGSFVAGLIDESDVKYGKNVTVKVGNEDREGREVVVSLSSEKTKKLLQGIADKISSDDTLLKLTYGNYSDVIKLVDEAGIFQLFEVLDQKGYLKLNKTLKSYMENVDVKKDLDKFKASIKDYGNSAVISDGLKMTLVIDKSGAILDRKTDISYSKSSGEKTAIDIHTGTNDVKNDDFKNGFCEIALSSTDTNGQKQAVLWSFNSDITPSGTGSDKKGKIEITNSNKVNDKEEFSAQIKLDLDKKQDPATLKDNSTVKYDIGFKGGESAATDRFNGEIDTVSWKNNKTKTRDANTTLLINADLPSYNLKNTSLKLDLKKEDRLEIPEFSLPEVQPANEVDLNNISDAGLLKVENEMLSSFGTFYLQNKPMMDAIFAK